MSNKLNVDSVDGFQKKFARGDSESDPVPCSVVKVVNSFQILHRKGWQWFSDFFISHAQNTLSAEEENKITEITADMGPKSGPGIVTGYGLGGRGSISSMYETSLHSVQTDYRAYTASYSMDLCPQ